MKYCARGRNRCRWAAMLAIFTAVALQLPAPVAAQFARPVPRAARPFDPGIAGPAVISPQPYYSIDVFPFAPMFGYPVANLGFPQPLGHQIVETSPNGYYYRPVTDLSEFVARAAAALRAADYPQVLVELQPVLAEDSDDGQAWMLRAQALFGMQSYARAAQALHSAMRLLPAEEWGRPVLKCDTYFASAGEFSARLRALESHVAAHPREGSGHFLLGYYYAYSGKGSQAERELRTALQLMTGDDELAQALLDPLTHKPPDQKPRPGLPREERGNERRSPRDEKRSPREF